MSIAAEVNAELERLEATFKGVDPASIPEFARGLIEQDRTLLERARSATSPHLRLYRLRDATVGIETLTYLVAHRADGTDLEKFRALWEAEGKEFEIASKREDIEKLVASLEPQGTVVIASDAVRKAFSGPPAVPTLVLADERGNIVKIFYGAPDTLHDEVAPALDLLDSPSAASAR